MSLDPQSRRQFARTLGAGLGASVIAPSFAGAGVVAAERGSDARHGGGAGVAPHAGRLDLNAPVRLDSNENPYGPSPAALAAMARAEHLAARYPDAAEDRVVEAIARLHRLDPENVVLGCGSGEILKMADMAFLEKGKRVVAAEPTFEAVLDYARVMQAEPVKVPLTPDFRHDLPRMAAACDGSTGLVYLCNPNNPTGTIVARDEVAAFLDRVPKSAVVLVDEAYHHFVEDTRYASASEWVAQRPNLVVCRTFSKIYGLAGMRLGYGLGSKERVAAMRSRKIWSNANASVLEAALACLGDPALVPQERRQLNDTRRWLCRELERDGRRFIPSEANFVMIDVGGDVLPVIAALRERRILAGRKFPSLPNWLRVSIGTPEEVQAFATGLRAVVPAPAPRAA
jgi:histidinol-phosphate aminotransferase